MRRVAAVAVAATALACMIPTSGAEVTLSPSEARARRAAVLLKAAELTDRMEDTQAEVVAAQLRQTRADDALSRARRTVRARAVNAYVHGTGAAITALSAPRPYLEVAANRQGEVLTRHRHAAALAVEERRRAEASHDQLAEVSAELSRLRSELDAVVAADDAARAEQQRQADLARHAALARQNAVRLAARGGGGRGPSGVASPSGYAPSPLDPGALLPRHKQATQRQLALMARIPFGPLGSAAPLPAGLVSTGQRVEGEASWYGPGFNGRPTASGAIYDQEGWTVASPDLPLGTILVVSRGERRALLLVNDRGPYVGGRVLDLSAAAARELGIGGVAPVVGEVVRAP
ncbi:MAG TPA: septal ring lytic transglycosylase RlpA family protein [Acidimicrobiales bacterium]|nr:septal ring lytic transglycosylase RlpA family protein [Acidimicrobiales bacterium]